MMTTINPYVGFNGKCREALTFYQHCLGGGELNFMTFEDTPMSAQCAPEMKHHIVHSSLMKGPLVLMGTDMTAPGGFTHGNSMAVSVNCSSEEEINSFFDKFSQGGKIIDPLGVKFWGGIFGVIDDQYGVRWMFNFNKDEQN
jgi:PhnB protein